MLPIEPLGLSANQWQFLSDPDRFVRAAQNTERPLVLESTRRQFRTAADILVRLNGSYDEKPVRGMLLADDVGLGKTTVGALAAWVIASAGEGRSVRILAPNDLVMRRWEKELKELLVPLQDCAPHLQVRESRVKVGRVRRLPPRSVQVVKHSYAVSGQRLSCDLLVIDEAHRAKGDQTKFSQALREQRKHAKRILILTATPFSIELEELNRMLKLVDAEQGAARPVRAFKKALNDLYTGSTGRMIEKVAAVLADKAQAAVEALAPYVIRHGVDDLPAEADAFGKREDWTISVPPASAMEQELIIRMDRVIRVAQGHYGSSARFHVGWLHYDSEMTRIGSTPLNNSPASEVTRHHLTRMRQLRSRVGAHTKMVAVAKQVESVLCEGEKVVLFCDHIATAQELAMFLQDRLPPISPNGAPDVAIWQRAWTQALGEPDSNEEGALRDTYVRWLCSELVRAQVWSWLPSSTPAAHLASRLRVTPARGGLCRDTILDAANHLYETLIESRSSRAVLKAAADDRMDLLPGANGASRVLAVCDRPERTTHGHVFTDRQQPDTAIAVFNSPFGPDVLIATDRLSEGIDLHRYCRHLIHYELDPGPIRTVQRNGRLRRVGGWAATTKRHIRYAYPAFRGTRDYRLVQIMKKRIDSFSLLLGGVQGFEVEEVGDADETWRSEVIQMAKSRLLKVGALLKARDRTSALRQG